MQFDLLGIGSAIVDVLAKVDESFIRNERVQKGSMTLINELRAEELYSKISRTIECSGGSVANSLAAFASLGGKGAFIGKVKNDQLGEIFKHDMHSIGVHFATTEAHIGPATARCIVLITPDGERTMNTYLGACTGLSARDMDESVIGASKITYIEGYQWDQPAAKEAIRRAIEIAKKHEKQVALTLSDSFCVERHRDEFLELASKVDILFANEFEIMSLLQSSSLKKVSADLQKLCPLACITRGHNATVVQAGAEHIEVPAEKIAHVVDSTGAGDLFAAGFLFGYTQGWSHGRSAALGNRCAANIIQQVGARSAEPLDRLVA